MTARHHSPSGSDRLGPRSPPGEACTPVKNRQFPGGRSQIRWRVADRPVGRKEPLLLAEGIGMACHPASHFASRRVAWRGRLRAFATLGMIGLWSGCHQASDAGSGLTTVPAHPIPGRSFEIRYRMPELLPFAPPSLVVRARVRTPGDMRDADQVRAVKLATLTRLQDGSYRGTAQLPERGAYLAMAVESPDGSWADSNGGRLWEVLARDTSGAPSADALIQRAVDVQARNWAEGRAAAMDATRKAPDRPDAWVALFMREAPITPSEELDSLVALHRATLSRLDLQLDPVAAPPWVLFAMALYSEILDDPVRQSRWQELLYAHFPMHPLAAEFRTVDMFHQRGTDAPILLSGLDSLWKAQGAGHTSIAWEGATASRELGDWTLMELWTNRYADVPDSSRWYGTYPPASEGFLRRSLARSAGGDVRDRALNWLRRSLAEEPGDVDRPVGITVDASASAWRQGRSRDLQALGMGLLAGGHPAAALDTLEEAARLEWDVDLLGTVSRIHRETGDVRGAIPWMAAVAADPSTAATERDSLEETAVAILGPNGLDEWNVAVGDGRATMRALLFQDSVAWRPKGTAEVIARDGRRVVLNLPTDGPTLVAFWSRFCQPSLDQLPFLAELTQDLERVGVRVVTISEEPPSPELEAFLNSRGVRLSTATDIGRSTSRALEHWGTPEYFLMDRSGTVKFVERELGRILQLATLLNEG